VTRPAEVALPPATVEEHLAAVLAVVSALPALPVALPDAQGCLLAEDVVAPRPLPASSLAGIDGYAARAEDVAAATEQVPVSLMVVGDMQPGTAAGPLAVRTGCAVRVSAGTALPPGADVVIPVTWTDRGLARVAVRWPPPAGGWVRAEGSELASGASLLSAGTRLGPAELGALAVVGRAQVLVHPRPRVVIVSTSRGMVDAGTPPGPGQEVDGGSHLLAAAVREAGGTAFRVGVLPDDPRRLLDALEDHLIRADLVLATGGAAGATVGGIGDVVSEVLQRLGTVSASRVALHPGGTFSVGVVGPDKVPYIGLPGQPVAALVGFHLFVAPALAAMRGAETTAAAQESVVVGQGFVSPAGRRHLVPAKLDPRTNIAALVGAPGMHPLVACGLADLLLMVPDETTTVVAGSRLPAIRL
jgi:molybdopterin molybdotransferase